MTSVIVSGVDITRRILIIFVATRVEHFIGMHDPRRLTKVIKRLVVVSQVDVHDSSIEVEVLTIEDILLVIISVILVPLRLLVIFAHVCSLCRITAGIQLPIQT